MSWRPSNAPNYPPEVDDIRACGVRPSIWMEGGRCGIGAPPQPRISRSRSVPLTSPRHSHANAALPVEAAQSRREFRTGYDPVGRRPREGEPAGVGLDKGSIIYFGIG